MLAIVGVVLTSVTALATTSINYGTFTGTSVSYHDVTESSGTDALPLFGAPTISVNTLDFNPQGFSAYSTGGGVDLTDGQLNFVIKAGAGYAIPSLQFSEAGDFTLAGLGTGSTKVTVASAFFIDVLKVDGLAINPLSLSANMTYAPNLNGQFNLSTDAGVGTIWNGALNFNLNSALAANGISFLNGATEIRVNLDNTLLAMSETGSVAYIAKKDFKGFAITVASVPEPSVMALGLLGVAALGLRARSARR